MTKQEWNELFGEKFFITLNNPERKYFGLNELSFDWEASVFYSKTNLWYKRTILYWNGDTIVKVIFEEMRGFDDRVPGYFRQYCEYDTLLETEDREWLLPFSEGGKKKKVTAANVRNIMAFGCTFSFICEYNESYISVGNYRNNQRLAIGEQDKICKIRNDADFRSFIEDYIKTCPEGYFDRVDRIRNSKHVTVKYQVGDIFRIEFDRFRYCYGLITGEVKKIQKWKEIHSKHSLSSLMTVPLMVRYYNLITENGNLTASDLEHILLGRLDICSDCDIIWGTYPIVSHKELTVNDIEFNLVCTRINKLPTDSHSNVFSGSYLVDMFGDSTKEFKLYVEWGTAFAVIPYWEMSKSLREYMRYYKSPHSGVGLGIDVNMVAPEESESRKYSCNLLNENNADIREELFSCLGISADVSLDEAFEEFAAKFGGLTKEQILKKLQ